MVVILYPSALRLCTCFSVVASQPRAWGERCDYESNKSCRWRCYRTLAKLGTILLAILKSSTSLICSILRQIGRPLPAKIRMGYTGECPQAVRSRCQELVRESLSSQCLASALNRGRAPARERSSKRPQFGALNSVLRLVPTCVTNAVSAIGTPAGAKFRLDIAVIHGVDGFLSRCHFRAFTNTKAAP